MLSGSIVITHPNGFEQELLLGPGSLRVGSAPDCDLVLAGADIAPHHATIACDERDRLVVEICGENMLGQGGMRLTFNLAQITRRRDLAWFGDYVVSYQPASWDHQTQPLRQADVPVSERAVGATPTAQRCCDETSLLHTLLGQSFVQCSYAATTQAMPLMALAAYDG
jgi:hypothetical protein